MNTNTFTKFHPLVNFLYFVLVIGFSCLFMHPVFLFVSLLSSFVFLIFLKGKKYVKPTLLYTFSLVLIMALLNPLFNHEGVTILTYLPSGNPLTFESIIYGIFASIMICNVINWFSCYNEIMTSDKFIYLFGKITPTLALILSMTLRFIPEFKRQLKEISDAQKCIGNDISTGKLTDRIKNVLSIISIMTTRALENSITTADSMKSRGYGLKKRTSYSNYKFLRRDIIAIILMLLCFLVVISGKVFNCIDFTFFPAIKYSNISYYSIFVFFIYFLLCNMPIIIELWEVR